MYKFVGLENHVNALMESWLKMYPCLDARSSYKNEVCI